MSVLLPYDSKERDLFSARISAHGQDSCRRNWNENPHAGLEQGETLLSIKQFSQLVVWIPEEGEHMLQCWKICYHCVCQWLRRENKSTMGIIHRTLSEKQMDLLLLIDLQYNQSKHNYGLIQPQFWHKAENKTKFFHRKENQFNIKCYWGLNVLNGLIKTSFFFWHLMNGIMSHSEHQWRPCKQPCVSTYIMCQQHHVQCFLSKKQMVLVFTKTKDNLQLEDASYFYALVKVQGQQNTTSLFPLSWRTVCIHQGRWAICYSLPILNYCVLLQQRSGFMFGFFFLQISIKVNIMLVDC